MRLLLTGNNDGPLRLARSLRATGLGGALATGLQKPVQGDLAEAYAREAAVGAVSVAQDEAAALALCDVHRPELIVNAFANYRFTELLSRARCLNVHLAPLPRYRGRHPLQWALINGETRYGLTVHEMNARWDDGAILYQAHVDVPPLSSAAQLRERLMQRLDAGFGDFLAAFAKTGGTPLANPAAEGSYLPRRSPADAELVEWDDPALLRRKAYALRDDAHPGFVRIGDAAVLVRAADPASATHPTPGSPIVVAVDADALTVATPGGPALRLTTDGPPPPESLGAPLATR